MFTGMITLASKVGSVIVNAFGYLVENPQNALIVIAAIILLGLSGYVGYRLGNSSEQGQERFGVTIEDEPLTEDRLVDPTNPFGITISPPDTNNIDTVRVVVPRYITRTDTVHSVEERIISSAGATLPTESPSITLTTSPLPSRGFLALPILDGSPTVHVTHERTVINTFDPRDGSGVTLRYGHPKKRFRVNAYSEIAGTYGVEINATGVLGLQVEVGRFGITGGYQFDPAVERSGLHIQTNWTPTLASW